MAKIIAVREEVYKKLLNLKGKDKSFSDVIIELSEKKGDLRDFIGMWGVKEAEVAKKKIKRFRKKVDKDLKNVLLRN